MAHLKNAVFGLAVSFMLSAPAMADVLSSKDCTSKINGQTVEVVSVETEGGFDLTLTADGKEVSALGGKCFYSDRPGTRYVLCAYQVGNARLDVYPWVQTVSGMIKPLQYILTVNGKQSGPYKFSSCSK